MSNQNSGANLRQGNGVLNHQMETIRFHQTILLCFKSGQTVFTEISRIGNAIGIKKACAFVPIGHAYFWLLSIPCSVVSIHYRKTFLLFKKHMFNHLFTIFFLHTPDEWSKMPSINYLAERRIV